MDKPVTRWSVSGPWGYAVIFLLLLVSAGIINFSSASGDEGRTKTQLNVIREGETVKTYGEAWFHLRDNIKIDYNLSRGMDDYVYVWSPWTDLEAPDKGWLTVENGFYRINVNLDHSYYMLYDKINDRDVLVYNDEVEDPVNILTGSDIGFADHGGDNVDFFASTGIHDVDGISRHRILWESPEEGFVLVGLEGWNYQPDDFTRGYDVEAEVFLGVFSNKPNFIDATEVNNLQKMDLFTTNIPYKNPDEVGKSWVLSAYYDSAVVKGGDLEHLNAN
jgi:hypothetical protein